MKKRNTEKPAKAKKTVDELLKELYAIEDAWLFTYANPLVRDTQVWMNPLQKFITTRAVPSNESSEFEITGLCKRYGVAYEFKLIYTPTELCLSQGSLETYIQRLTDIPGINSVDTLAEYTKQALIRVLSPVRLSLMMHTTLTQPAITKVTVGYHQ